MEGQRVIFLVIFSIHLAVVRLQEKQIPPTAVTRSSTRDSETELQNSKVYTVPTTEAKYGPDNVTIHYTSDRKELWEGRGEITITCNADCNPRCNYWIRHSGHEVSTEKTYTFTMDRKNSGEYSCAARNSVSTSASFSKTITLDIKYDPSNVTIHYTGDGEELWEGGGKKTITCNADCNPQCNRWRLYHNRRWLSSKKTYAFAMDRENSGQYSCTASNSVSTPVISSNSITLDIKYGPTNVTIQYTSDRDELWEGDGKISITCNADCNPQCNYWTVYRNGDWFSVQKTTSITMDRKNSGQYSCSARNSVRGTNVKSSNTVRLHIKYKIVRLSSIKKIISLGVNRNLPSNAVCTIDCNYEGCDSSTITVLRNSEVYNTIDTNQSIFPSRQALLSDDGIYKCKLSDNTESHKNLQLAIIYGPRNLSIMKGRRNADAEIVLIEWDSGTSLTCSADCNPACNTSWYKDGQLLSHQQHKTINIRSYRWNSGNYKCEASGVEGTVSSTQVKITVQYSPKNVTIQYTSDTEELWEGNGAITITCNADCNPPCNYYIHVRRPERYTHRVYSDKTKVLTMNRIHSGQYSCAAWNSVWRTPVTSSNSITLDIKYGPKIVKIMKGRRNVDAEIVLREGSYGTWLTCSSDCNPTCNISWYRDQHVMSHQRRKTFYITSNRRNSGNYKCVASGIKETVSSKQVRITVQYKPIVTIPNFPRIAAPGSLKLNLSVDSFPASNVTIFHKEEKLKFFSNFTGNKTYEINISSCLDGGKYRIVAENIIGKQSTSKKLTVQCSPIILTFSNITNKGFEIGDELNLTVKFMANPNPNASWTFFPKEGDVSKGVPKTPTATGKGFTNIIVSNMSLHDFGTYQLTLSNKFGRNEMEFNIQGAPQPPTELTVNCSNAALIEWKPGFDGGIDQTFVIEYTTNVSSSWLSHNPHIMTSKDVEYLSTEINFLQPCVLYFFRIVAKNRFGSRRSDITANCIVQSDSTMYDLSTDQDGVIDQILTSSLSNAKTTNRRNIIRKEEILTLKAEREKYNQETKKLREETGYYRIKTMYLNMRMSQVNKGTERGGEIS